jgi:hypothetical protein
MSGPPERIAVSPVQTKQQGNQEGFFYAKRKNIWSRFRTNYAPSYHLKPANEPSPVLILNKLALTPRKCYIMLAIGTAQAQQLQPMPRWVLNSTNVLARGRRRGRVRDLSTAHTRQLLLLQSVSAELHCTTYLSTLGVERVLAGALGKAEHRQALGNPDVPCPRRLRKP